VYARVNIETPHIDGVGALSGKFDVIHVFSNHNKQADAGFYQSREADKASRRKKRDFA
jgi:hypothetical protein